MFDGFLEIGMKVTIEVKRENGELFFPSKIEDICKDSIILSMPMKGGRTFFVGTDERINIYFPRKDSFYCIEGKVEDKQYKPIPVIRMHPLGSPYKSQKRNYFRLKFSLPVHIKLLGTEDTFRRYTHDFSAGGIKFAHPKMIEEGAILEVKIPDILGDKTIKASVIRTEKEDTRPVNKYDIAIEFVDIDEHSRDKIIKFILAKQRELRHKGLNDSN